MKVEKLDGSRERKILIGVITNKFVLGRLSNKKQDVHFNSKYADILFKWCVDFYDKYQDAPKKQIISIFESWVETNKDEGTQELISKFLSSLSQEYEKQEEQNSEHLIDLAGKYFTKVKIQKLLETLEGNLLNGDLEKAEASITKYSRVELGLGSGVNLFNDKEAIKATFSEEAREQLITYPGALGDFFHGTLERDSFLCFMASQKAGKTFCLLDIAYRAMLNRKKVAFFEIGDLSEVQIKERFLVRASKHPLRAREWPTRVRIPINITIHSQQELPRVDFETKIFDKPLNQEIALKACEETIKKVRSKSSYFRLSCHANFSVSILGIESILNAWELENWLPDVLVIDYADNLSPCTQSDDIREGVNTTWKHLRRISQEKHLLLITATQANALSYTTNYLTRRNFSEDNRKLSHVNNMCGINSSEDEKELGVIRLNWIVAREREFSAKKWVYVAQCLPLANPFVKSAIAGYEDE